MNWLDCIGAPHVLTTGGYMLAIVGALLLFLNTPPDVGGNYALMIPKVSGTKTDWTGMERKAIISRRAWNRFGFLLLLVGTTLQLAGYWRSMTN